MFLCACMICEVAKSVDIYYGNIHLNGLYSEWSVFLVWAVYGLLVDACRSKLFPESTVKNMSFQVLSGVCFMHDHGDYLLNSWSKAHSKHVVSDFCRPTPVRWHGICYGDVAVCLWRWCIVPKQLSRSFFRTKYEPDCSRDSLHWVH